MTHLASRLSALAGLDARRWASALAGALLVAWALALADAWSLGAAGSAGGASPFPVTASLLGLWTLVALPSGGAGVAVAALVAVARGPGDGLARLARPAALLALGALCLHRVGLRLSVRSSDTLLLGLVLAGLALAPLLAMAGASVERLLARNSQPRRAHLTWVSLTILAAASLLCSLWSAHADYLDELFLREAGWGTLALALPLTAGSAAAGLASGARPAGEHARRWTRALLAVLALAAAALGVGVLGARAAGPAEARALRDGPGLSRPLVTAAFLVGVPTPPLGPAQGLRGCLAGAALGAPGSVGRVADAAPDILLITVDGLRFDHTSLLPGSQHPNTPHLLTYAERGAVFSRAYTPAPSTRAAFRAMFTGLLPGQVDAPRDPALPWALTLTASQPTLAAYLREAGYETIAYISKPKAFPRATRALSGFAEVDDAATPYHLRHTHSAQLKVSRIIGRLAEPPSDATAPRFVWTHFIEPHFPYTHGPMQADSGAGGPNERRHDRAVRYIDEQLERLLAFALAPERRDRTVVIITSDHGEAFDEHHNSRHGGTVHEEELHVPLVVLGGGVVPGLYATPVSLVELLPTILGLAGLATPEGVCGDGWAPTLRQGGDLRAAPLYAAALPDGTTRYHQLAFIDGDQKLIVDGETGVGQRYDLAADPQERHPDADSATTRALRVRFERFLTERGLPPLRSP